MRAVPESHQFPTVPTPVFGLPTPNASARLKNVEMISIQSPANRFAVTAEPPRRRALGLSDRPSFAVLLTLSVLFASQLPGLAQLSQPPRVISGLFGFDKSVVRVLRGGWSGRGTVAPVAMELGLIETRGPFATYASRQIDEWNYDGYFRSGLDDEVYRTEEGSNSQDTRLTWNRSDQTYLLTCDYIVNWENHSTDGSLLDSGGTTETLTFSGSVSTNTGTPVFDLSTIVRANHYGGAETTYRTTGELRGVFIGDLVARWAGWNDAEGGVDFRYEIADGPLIAGTTVKLFWANGPSSLDKLSDTPIMSQEIPPGSSGLSEFFHVELTRLVNPPEGATHVLILLDWGDLIPETFEDNNAFAVLLPPADLFPTYLAWIFDANRVDFAFTVDGFLPKATTVALFWANGPEFANRMSNIPFFSEKVPAGFFGSKDVEIAPSYLEPAPKAATHILIVADPEDFVVETDEDQNTMARALPPADLQLITLSWNADIGGLDFSYAIQGYLLNSTHVKLYWAKGEKIEDRLSAAPIYSQHERGGWRLEERNNVHVFQASLNEEPNGATHLLLVIDPDDIVAETDEDNNVLSLHNLQFGVDVSHFQNDAQPNVGTLDWNTAKTFGKRFACVKATQGVAYRDPWFARNMTDGAAAGLLMGAYHFAEPELHSALQEAHHFLETAGPFVSSGYLRPALDVEDYRASNSVPSRLGSARLSHWVSEWLNEVHRLTGVRALVYCNLNYARLFVEDFVRTNDLWLAQYTGDPEAYDDVSPWGEWTVFQYSETGLVPGIHSYVDLDAFRGTKNELVRRLVIPPAQLVVSHRTPHGQIRLEAFVPGSQSVTLQASDALQNWTDVGPLPISFGRGEFNEAVTSSRSRFFRLQPPHVPIVPPGG